MRFLPLAAVLALALAASCARSPKLETEEAVRGALERYLAARPNLNMQGMDMQIGGIQFKGQTAEVDVVFRARSGGDQGTLSMRYILNRRGDRWEVEPQSGAHGGMVPPANPGSATELPSGHPPVKTP